MSLSLLSSYLFETDLENGDSAYVYENVWQDYATQAFTNIFMYMAIALAVVLIGVGLFVKFYRQERLASFLKVAGGICAGFVITVIVTMFGLSYMRIFEKGYEQYDMLLYYVMVPTIILGAIAVAGIIAAYIASMFSPKCFKITLIVIASLFGAMLICEIVLLAVYFNSGKAEYNNWEFLTKEENVWLYVSAAILVAAIAALAIFFGRKKKNGFDSKSISYAAICIAMSFALSYIKFIEMPQGGPLTLASLVPLLLYSYMFGTKKGVLAGLVYGVLQAVQDPWIIHPAQFLLDYPIAFAAIGLGGIFGEMKALEKLPQVKFALGAVVAGLLRYVSHILSGVFAFNSFAAENGINEWVYSLTYNAFVWPDIAIAIAVGVILLSSRAFASQVQRVQAESDKRAAVKKEAEEAQG